jgi:chromosome segregation ATPase
VSQAESSHLETLQAEIAHLQGELQLRDQLVDQLSHELFRLVQDYSNATSLPSNTESDQSQLEGLQGQIAEIEEQVQFYQKQISTRDEEIYQLQSKIKTLTEKNKTLEKMLHDLPELYRQKFAQRMKPVKEKVEQLQRENQQLHAQVQTLTYRLTVRNRSSHDHDIDLPNIQQQTDQPS